MSQLPRHKACAVAASPFLRFTFKAQKLEKLLVVCPAGTCAGDKELVFCCCCVAVAVCQKDIHQCAQVFSFLELKSIGSPHPF